MPLHYHAISGDRGYVPDAVDTCESYAQAVEILAQRFELGKKRTKELRDHGWLDLRPRDGAEYAEIMSCYEDCDLESE